MNVIKEIYPADNSKGEKEPNFIFYDSLPMETAPESFNNEDAERYPQCEIFCTGSISKIHLHERGFMLHAGNSISRKFYFNPEIMQKQIEQLAAIVKNRYGNGLKVFDFYSNMKVKNFKPVKEN